MAEESPLSPNSHKRRIIDTVTPHDHPTLNLSLLPSSEVEPSSLELVGVSESQETHSFPQQSPKKPKFEGSISDDIVESNSNHDNGKPEFQGKGTLFSKEGVKFDVKIEVSELKFDEKNEASEVGFERNEVSELKFDERNEASEVGCEQDEVSELKFDEKNDVSEAGFERNEVIGENSCEIGENFGVNESGELGFEKKSENLDGVLLQKLLKKEDSTKSSLKIEVIDGTALLDVSLIGEKKNRRKGNNYNNKKMKNNSRNNGVNSVNEGKKKCVYSRKELELLRYVNVKGQRKFWQEIYDGFSAIVKKDYDEVGSFRFQRNGGSSSEYNGGKKSFNDGGIMGGCLNGPYCNNRGILGVAAARGRCNNTNIFVYKRKRILNANA